MPWFSAKSSERKALQGLIPPFDSVGPRYQILHLSNQKRQAKVKYSQSCVDTRESTYREENKISPVKYQISKEGIEIMKEKLTVHKALSELKILNDRIQREIDDIQFVLVNKHSNQKINGAPVKEYMEQTKEKYQSVTTLINRRNAIKRAVTRSNAVTTVDINGTEYTVAEAIDMKAVGVNHLRQLLQRMEYQFKQAQNQAERENGDRLDNRADDYMRSLYQNTDLKNMTDELKKVRENFITAQTVEILDPVKVTDEITKLRDKIDAFMSEVDSALSVSNALTTIIVDYETV